MENRSSILWFRKLSSASASSVTAAVPVTANVFSSSLNSNSFAQTSAQPPERSEKERVTADWLLSRVEEFASLQGIDSGLDPERLSSEILRVLKLSSSIVPADQALMDLLGWSDAAMNLIANVLEKRDEIVKVSSRNSNKSSSVSRRDAVSSNNSSAARNPASGRPPAAASAPPKNYVPSQGGTNAPLPAGTTRAWGEVASTMQPDRAALAQKGRDTSTSDSVVTKYESVFVPARPAATVEPSKLINVNEALGPVSRLSFKGVTHLNTIQSHVFPIAFHSSENMLVCAPTGAGKTNVAMLTIAREIERASHPKQVRVVYVAPMKALAQEVVTKFSERLASLQMQVRELTGDMQLSRQEIDATNIIVTTPEKWDVVTRKASDDSFSSELNLLIIDEVHLVGEDRGPVIEALVSRVLRRVEQRQKMVRIVGLSATLPNYKDVAIFLRANIDTGCFFFDSSFRPVPLEQTFIGLQPPTILPTMRSDGVLSEPKVLTGYRAVKITEAAMNEIAFKKATASVNNDQQVMVFVHSRKDTSKTLRAFVELAGQGDSSFVRFIEAKGLKDKFALRVSRSKSSELRELFEHGLGLHHAGMAREDRNLTEDMFSAGAIALLCCTATLAWGVNLPAHTVILKGTQIYAPDRGGLCELNSADVFQCFGRAGRPQYDTSGEAVLITGDHAQLPRYLGMLTHTLPLESKLIANGLADALNAEIVSGTVSNYEEASQWLSYTFLYIRMLRSPMTYGVSAPERERDPTLVQHRLKLVASACKSLEEARMIRLAHDGSAIGTTDLGRVASHFYVQHETVEKLFNEGLKQRMTDTELIEAICSRTKEFDQIKVREEEVVELKRMARTVVPLSSLTFLPDTPQGKTVVLFCAFISRYLCDAFTLSSDMNYVSQNAARILRAVFEVASAARKWAPLASQALNLCSALEKRCWFAPIQSPLRQLAPAFLPLDVIATLERAKFDAPQHVTEGTFDEKVVSCAPSLAPFQRGKVKQAVGILPYVEVNVEKIQPIAPTLLSVTCSLTKYFEWRERVHMRSQNYWLFVEDDMGDWILHSERVSVSQHDGVVETTFSLPMPLQNDEEDVEPIKYVVRVENDSGWLGCGSYAMIDLSQVQLPLVEDEKASITDVMDLDPLSLRALNNPSYEGLYEKQTHYDPIQTQCFHTLYHRPRDHVLIAGPLNATQKSVLAETAFWGCLKTHEDSLIVYLASTKAAFVWKEVVREWRRKFRALSLRVSTSMDPDQKASLWILTPENFRRALVTRQTELAQRLKLVVVDEMEVLNEIPSLEFILAHLKDSRVRRVGLCSSELANPKDVSRTLSSTCVTYNFRSRTRIPTVELHIQGFPGVAYGHRQSSMNKPIFHAITKYVPNGSTLIIVSTRRQIKLTAFDLISLCGASEDPKRFLNGTDVNTSDVSDGVLRDTLQFGIALQHVGLSRRDAEFSRRAFGFGAARVMICTMESLLNADEDVAEDVPELRADLVVIKGTEMFDEVNSRRWHQIHLNDLTRFGQRSNKIVLLTVHDQLKEYYKRFLSQPFPIESSATEESILAGMNSEVVSTLANFTMERAKAYFARSFYAIRLHSNPSYYESATTLLNAEDVVRACQTHGWIDANLASTDLGRVCARYNLEVSNTEWLKKLMESAPVTLQANSASLSSEWPKDGSLVGLILVSICAQFASEMPQRPGDEEFVASHLPKLLWNNKFEGTKGLSARAMKCLVWSQIWSNPASFKFSRPEGFFDAKSWTQRVLLRGLPAFIELSAKQGKTQPALAGMSLFSMLQERSPEPWKASFSVSTSVRVTKESDQLRIELPSANAWILLVNRSGAAIEARPSLSGNVVVEDGTEAHAIYVVGHKIRWFGHVR